MAKLNTFTAIIQLKYDIIQYEFFITEKQKFLIKVQKQNINLS